MSENGENKAANPVKGHLDYLEQVATEDVAGLLRAEKEYGSSWKRRGGVGAFMMLARKWDRLELALSPRGPANTEARCSKKGLVVQAYDIFGAIESDTRLEGVIDDIRDLRRYLLLVEAEMRARGCNPGPHRDNRS